MRADRRTIITLAIFAVISMVSAGLVGLYYAHLPAVYLGMGRYTVKVQLEWVGELYLGVLFGVVVSFCAVSLTVGYLAPWWMHLPPRQAIAVSLEIGVHNAAIAMGIALSPQLLNSAEISAPAAIYGVLAPFIALAFVVAVRDMDSAFRDVGRSDSDANDPLP